MALQWPQAARGRADGGEGSIHLIRPQMHFGGSAAEVAETLRAIAASMATAQSGGVNVVLEDAQFYFGAASSANTSNQQQQLLQQNQHQQYQYGGGTAVVAGVPRPRMWPDPPSFEPAFTVSGLDFGFELAQRRCYCDKYTDENFDLILYTQSPRSQQVQSVLRVMSMGMSTKRSKHVIFMFDTDVNYQSFNWPDRVRLEDVKHKLIKRVIGQDYDLSRKKVSKESFTLYVYGVKRRHIPFSEYACLKWAMLVYWADSKVGEISGVSLSDQLASTARSMFSTAGGLMRPLLGTS